MTFASKILLLFVKRWFSILIFPSTFVHWNSTIRKSCTFSPTYLFIQLFIYQHEPIFILFGGLEFIIIIIYFVAEIAHLLITRSSFKLASMLFWHHAINFFFKLIPYCLNCKIFRAHLILSLAQICIQPFLQEQCLLFLGKLYLETKIWAQHISRATLSLHVCNCF